MVLYWVKAKMELDDDHLYQSFSCRFKIKNETGTKFRPHFLLDFYPLSTFCMVLWLQPGGSIQPGRSIQLRGSIQVETVQVHDLVPCRHKILNKFFAGIFTGVDLSNGPEL